MKLGSSVLLPEAIERQLIGVSKSDLHHNGIINMNLL